jgi:sterol desaturase/sphingolipid hydroxylase (fatty acid hydroxylase superfamily)
MPLLTAAPPTASRIALPDAIMAAPRRFVRLLADPATRYTTLSVLTAIPVLILRGPAILSFLWRLLSNPGSTFSLYSLAIAGVIAVCAVAARHLARRRRIHVRALLRVLFPRRLFRGASLRADLGFVFLNNFATAGLIGWGLLSGTAIAVWTHAQWTALLGPMHMGWLNPVAAGVVLTFGVFICAEFAYWFDHYLSHTVPCFWEAHRVHHTAETLTPLTVMRIHPLESLKFFNIMSIGIGVGQGSLTYALGCDGAGYLAWGTNMISVLFILTINHLLHTHVWIAFTGTAGRIFISPAHHQLHHSADPAHYGKNLGGALAIWDWMFGTLLLPEKSRQKLVFGVENGTDAVHTITGALVTPCVRSVWAAGQMLRGRWSGIN